LWKLKMAPGEASGCRRCISLDLKAHKRDHSRLLNREDIPNRGITMKRKKILLAYDGSECADAAIEDLRFAGLPNNLQITVFSVARPIIRL
jgi:hypothetical protein